MPLDLSRQPASSSASFTTHHLKRSYAQQAYALDRDSYDHTASPSAGPSSSRFNTSGSPRPAKSPRIEKSMSKLPSRGSFSRTHNAPGRSHDRWAGSSKAFGKKRARDVKPTRNLERIEGPLYTEEYITKTYRTKPLKQGWADNAKSAILNWSNTRKISPKFEQSELYAPNGTVVWRANLTLEYEGETIVAYGDDAKNKTAEKLACLAALYIIDAKDMMQAPKAPKPDLAPAEATLSDGTTVDFEKARQFMDYYCRRFGFGKPDITHATRKNIWEAVMTVGGKRIGMGSGLNKKAATQSCYVDVVVYLESCDSELWKKFVDDARTGKDLGMAPSVTLQVDDRLEDQIQSLCSDIKRSTLYKNRPRLNSLMTGDDDPAAMGEAKPPVQLYIPPKRRQATEGMLAAKSTKLLERREEYLVNPNMEKMRQSRGALPVYSKSEEVMKHIEEHDVTICMAATGSGKTTQLPQLILDQWIDRGEGAKCNIVCTQPRRLAAISVANRVAAERSESIGQSVGYQVRFESRLPERNGSITFCTIGVFLRRMQNDLLGVETDKALDDVTHLLVDEVHERDVDTDLLLVVLKRLLADRKARGKPLKIVLMSATIDPKLFQEYFSDDEGKPAGVVDIPGRSFPVKKHFLDEFIPAVVKSADPAAKWVIQDATVNKYLHMELDPPAVLSIYGGSGSFRAPPKRTDDEPDVPHALIGLTIAHVLRHSEDGHVLVFLPGWDDISGVQKLLRTTAFGLDFNSDKFSIHVLHSSIPVAEQQVIFDAPPPGQRRIILSTNIAETSVTIPDVVYVVDTAKLKEKRYNPEKHISALVSAPVGKSNLNQRAGRAGRHRSGEYYGLLTRRRADALETHQTVEMKRVDLSNVVMHVKALNFPGMTVEEVLAATIEPPAVERIEAAMKSLQMVGALDSNKQLTSLGRVLLQLPLDAQMGRLVLYGCFFRCLDPALTLAALLGGREPFLSPMHMKQEAAARKESFSPEDYRSDAIAMLRAYNAWWEKQSKGLYVSANSFCMDNFLSKPTLMQVPPIKTQLLQTLYDIGVIDVCAGGEVDLEMPRGARRELTVPQELNENAGSLPVVAAMIATALQPHFAIRTGEKALRTATDKMVFIHPSSVNNRKRVNTGEHYQEKELIAYAEKRQNLSVPGQAGLMYIVMTTRLDPLTYILFGAHHIDVTRRGLECDEWLPVVGNVDALDDLERLKVLLESCMLRVYQGIIKMQTKRKAQSRYVRRDDREDESGDEDEADSALTSTEKHEFDLMTRDVVRIMTDYHKYRIANQSRRNSRPGTPITSPMWTPGRLPPLGSGARSGYSTPRFSATTQFHSRPNTPSRLR